MWFEKVQTKNGPAYRFYERYEDPFSGKMRRVSILLNSRSKQAQKTALYKLQDKIKEALKAADTNITLDAAIAEYYETKSKFLKPSTLSGIKYTSKALLEFLPKDILLSKLTTAIVQHAFENFQTKYSYSYAKNSLAILRNVLKYSRRLGYIDNISFLEDVELTKVKKDVAAVIRDREKFLTEDELKEFLNKLGEIHKNVALICEFQSLTGLRIGELSALRVCDYDKKTHEIDINATLCTARSLKDPSLRISPKNVYSIRRVTLDARAEHIINYFITAKKARELWKAKLSDYNDYIFVTDGGLPYDSHYINKVLKKVEFHKHVSTHTFRHTHISLLAESGVSLKAIMERVGHNEPRTTLAVYTHVTNKMKDQVKAAISGMGNALKHR